MELVMMMLRSMQELQRKVLEKEDCCSANGVELVWEGVNDLPTLAEWDASDAPLKMGTG